MRFRSLCPLFLLLVLLPIGCTTDPNPNGPSAPSRESVKAPASGPAQQPKSIADYRKEKLEKSEGGPRPSSPQ